MKTRVLLGFFTTLLPLALSATKPPQQITAAEAKDHDGEVVMVCGTAVDSKISKYAIPGHGKTVTFDLDQPEPNPLFYFVAFGSDAAKLKKLQETYQGQRVCVTGKITKFHDVPYVMVTEASQLKLQAAGQK
jgi:DNA/RNA endonuclease YhcR with UshA esterase domain